MIAYCIDPAVPIFRNKNSEISLLHHSGAASQTQPPDLSQSLGAMQIASRSSKPKSSLAAVPAAPPHLSPSLPLPLPPPPPPEQLLWKRAVLGASCICRQIHPPPPLQPPPASSPPHLLPPSSAWLPSPQPPLVSPRLVWAPRRSAAPSSDPGSCFPQGCPGAPEEPTREREETTAFEIPSKVKFGTCSARASGVEMLCRVCRKVVPEAWLCLFSY